MTDADDSADWLLDSPFRIARHEGKHVWFVRHLSVWRPGGDVLTSQSALACLRVGPFAARNSSGALRWVRVRPNIPYTRPLFCIDLDDLENPAATHVRAVNVTLYIGGGKERLSGVFADERRAVHRQILIRLSHDPAPNGVHVSTSAILASLPMSWVACCDPHRATRNSTTAVAES